MLDEDRRAMGVNEFGAVSFKFRFRGQNFSLLTRLFTVYYSLFTIYHQFFAYRIHFHKDLHE
jgi:hypothetical protein